MLRSIEGLFSGAQGRSKLADPPFETAIIYARRHGSKDSPTIHDVFKTTLTALSVERLRQISRTTPLLGARFRRRERLPEIVFVAVSRAHPTPRAQHPARALSRSNFTRAWSFTTIDPRAVRFRHPSPFPRSPIRRQLPAKTRLPHPRRHLSFARSRERRNGAPWREAPPTEVARCAHAKHSSSADCSVRHTGAPASISPASRAQSTRKALVGPHAPRPSVRPSVRASARLGRCDRSIDDRTFGTYTIIRIIKGNKSM